jgi:hypothetical protein
MEQDLGKPLGALSDEEKLAYLTRFSPETPTWETLYYALVAIAAALVLMWFARRKMAATGFYYRRFVQVLLVASMLWGGVFLFTDLVKQLFEPPLSQAREIAGRGDHTPFDTVLEQVRYSLPDEAGVLLINCESPRQAEWTKYFLYPRRVVIEDYSIAHIDDPKTFLTQDAIDFVRSRGAEWVLDCRAAASKTGMNGALISLDSENNIEETIQKRKHLWQASKQPHNPYAAMGWFLSLVLLLMCVGLLLSGFFYGRGRIYLSERIALSLPLGAALTGSALVFGLVVFDRFTPKLIFWISGILFVACSVRYLVKLIRKIPPQTAPDDGQYVTRRDLNFVMPALLFTSLLTAIAFKDGVYGDALSIWGFKAMVIANSESIRIPAFLDPDYYHHHKDYPLLFPSLQAVFYRMSGDVLDRTAKLLYPILLLATALNMYFHLKRRFGFGAAISAGGLCLVTPSICGYHPGICSAYMDIPLGCFTVLALMFGSSWLRERQGTDAFLAGLFLGAMALTKNEGLAVSALAVLLFAVAGLYHHGIRGLLGWFWLLLPWAVLTAAWITFRREVPQGGVDYIGLITSGAWKERIDMLPHVAWRYLLEIAHFERWGFLWLLMLVTIPFWLRERGLTPGLVLFGMIGIHILAVTLSPLEMRYQIASALFRLPGQLAPLAAACVGVGMGRMALAIKSSTSPSVQ